MRILLHSNSLNERGTTRAILDYANFLKSSSIDVYIAYDGSDNSNQTKIIEQVSGQYETISYREFSHFEKQWANKFDVAYFIKYGTFDGKLMNSCPNLVHAVFQTYQPHGEEYFYVSEWLSKRMRFMNLGKIRQIDPRFFDSFLPSKFDFVPHIVELPESRPGYLDKFNFPDYVKIGGRHGGYDTFDVDFVKRTLLKVLDQHSDIVLVFANTRKFVEHPRIKYIPTLTTRQEVSDFLGALDFYLHARSRGESFGLSLLEAMYSKVPVFSYSGGIDGNHRTVLRDSSSSLFRNERELLSRIENLDEYEDLDRNFELATRYSQAKVGAKLLSKIDWTLRRL